MGKHRKPLPKAQHGSGANKTDIPKQKSKALSKLILEPRSDWYNSSLATIAIPTSLSQVPIHVLDAVQQYAETLLDEEAAQYATSHLQKSSSNKFMSTIMSSGTWSDKVSALTLVVQESPVHTLKSFETLLNLAGKKSRDQALMALGALKDMLGQGNVLPTDRKLRTFKKQPELLAALQGLKSWKAQDPLPKGLGKAHLVVWAFENRLKSMYFDLLRILESWCNDEVEFARLRAVTFAWELLKEKPEQEENLLRLVVNKLGDREKKVASRASYLVLQLQTTHPSMKEVIINAVQSDVMLRPGQSSRAKYYAVITLNQTVLQSSSPEVANKLLDVYFNLFITILNESRKGSKPDSTLPEGGQKSKKRKHKNSDNSAGAEKAEQEFDDKITAQVLTGINRAFPYSGTDSGTFEKHLDTMFRIAHSTNFNTSIQALLLIQQISSMHHISTDRFMRTLYESLLDPRLLKSSKQTMYLNLLYRSLKADVSLRRVKAFVKRLLQILHLHDPPFITAVLFLIHELQRLLPALKSMLVQPEASSEDTEEHFQDMPDPTDKSTHTFEAPAATVSNGTTAATATYDPRKRDPEHSHADQTCLWELTSPFLTHHHPSVALFSHSLVPAFKIRAPPKPDPQTHSLSHFLDRFVYRNPKSKHLAQGQHQSASSAAASVPLRGNSLMQPALGAASSSSILLSKSGRGDNLATPVNNETFWARRSEVQVAPEEVFFHRYFSGVGAAKAKAQEKREKKERKNKGGDDAEDEVDSELGVGEDEIWKALVGSGGGGLEGEEADEGSEGFDEDAVDYEDEDEEDGLVLGNNAQDGDGSDGATMDDFGEDDDVELNLESDDDSAIFGSEEEIDENASEIEADVDPVKGKAESKSKDGRKRRKLKSLPMFADASEYAKMLEGDDEETDW